MIELISLALGIFVINWLIIPMFSKRSFKDGFYIGLIVACLILMVGAIILGVITLL